MGSLHDKDEILKALGTLSVNYSDIEAWLTIFIEGLINTEDRKIPEIVTAELSIRSKIELLMSLFRNAEKNDKKIADLEALLSKIKRVNTRRNILVHSTWHVDEFEAQRWKNTAKFEIGFDREKKDVSLRDIEIVIEDIIKYSRELRDFCFIWMLEK